MPLLYKAYDIHGMPYIGSRSPTAEYGILFCVFGFCLEVHICFIPVFQYAVINHSTTLRSVELDESEIDSRTGNLDIFRKTGEIPPD